MPIRAVIFDMGGVLLRTESQHGRRKWESRLELKERELSQVVFGSEASARASIGLGTDADVWKNVASVLRLSDEQLKELERDFWSDDRIDAALVQFIRDLRPRCRTAILSNAWFGAREAISNKFGLGALVDAIIISAEEGIAKPDPRIYHIAAERLGVLPVEAVFVDDMEENVQAARAVGMRGVQFKDTAQALAEVRLLLNESA
jgi:epoxide hydrolase-like predicted phosphatase